MPAMESRTDLPSNPYDEGASSRGLYPAKFAALDDLVAAAVRDLRIDQVKMKTRDFRQDPCTEYMNALYGSQSYL